MPISRYVNFQSLFLGLGGVLSVSYRLKATVSPRFWTFVRDLMLSLNVLAFLLTIAVLFLNQNPWHLGDWLTNYSGGPTRRGFFGSILLPLGQINKEAMLLVLFFFLGTCFVILMGFWRAGPLASPTRLAGVFLFAPSAITAGLADPQYFGRKEVLFLLVAIWWLTSTAQSPAQSNLKRLGWICAWVILGLNHEAFMVFIPMLIGVAILMRWQDDKRPTVDHFIPLVSVIAFVAISLATVRGEISAAVCRSWARTGFDEQVLCSGSIAWLDKSPSSAVTMMGQFFNNSSFVLISAIQLTLCLALLFWASGKAMSKPSLASPILLGLLGLFSLVAISSDWGRWISVFFQLALFATWFLTPKQEARSITNLQLLVLVLGFFVIGFSHSSGDLVSPLQTFIQFAVNRLN